MVSTDDGLSTWILLDEFLDYFVRIGKFQQTLYGYRKDLRRFLRECEIGTVDQITRDVINDWVLKLRERKLSTGYIANMLWAVKAFLQFVKDEKHLPCYEWDIKIPKVKDPDYVEFVEDEELKQIFDSIDLENLHGLRLRMYIEVMINMGLRPSEALNLKRVQMRQEKFEIIGKGGKERIVYVNDRVRFWVEKYLATRHDTEPWLFITNCKPRQWKLRGVEEAFHDVVHKLGTLKKITLHTLRHTYATKMLSNGSPIEYVAINLGHASVRVTRKHYVSIQQKHAEAAHFRYLSYSVQ